MAHVEKSSALDTNSRQHLRSADGSVPPKGVAEVLCDLVDEVGLSQRYLSGVTQIKRTRLQRVLHSDPNQRVQMTIEEAEALKTALGIDEYDIAVELDFRRRDLGTSIDTVRRKVIIKGIMRGLAGELIKEMDLISEIDYDEVTPDLTVNLQKILAKCAGRSLQSFYRVCERHHRERSDPFRD